MRKYETVFILNPDSTEEKISDIVNKVTNIIENYNGDIEGIDHWGRKKLAYEINKKSEGYFILINFSSSEDLPKELDRNFKIMDDIIRHIVVNRK